MIFQALIYFLIGIMWTEWLEFFCMRNLDGKLANPFSNKEKFFQTILWPVFVGIFVFNFLDDIFKKL